MKTSEIILCSPCKGRGEVSFEECVDYHKREYDTVWKKCINCDGYGRVRMITEITIEKLKK